MAITGARKIAALLLTLDAEAAAKVLSHLDEDNLATVGHRVQRAGNRNVIEIMAS